MPMLDFACTACGHKFEELVALNPKAPPVCPQCGSAALTRVYEGPCMFGATSGAGGGGCGGNCAGCSGGCGCHK